MIEDQDGPDAADATVDLRAAPLEAAARQAAATIERVLADDESQPGGWGHQT